MGKLFQIYGSDAHTMTVALMEAADVAAMIPPGAKIALKPNLVVSAPAEQGATTHMGVLTGAIEYLQGRGFTDLSVIESAWVGDSTQRAFRICGCEEVEKKYHVPFYDLKQDRTRTVDTPLRPMEICCRALDAEFLIDLPVLKGHCQTAMTCALKNCKGCIPDREKRRFHTEGLMKPIAALAAALRPQLTIVDSICGDLDFEEGGNPVPTGRMYLGTDPVQVDAYGCQLLGLDTQEVPYIGLAEAWGAGCARVEPGDVVLLNQPNTPAEYPRPSGVVASLTRGVEARSACSACYAALVRALHRSGVKPDRVAIGQGWRNVPFDGLGIGNCCNQAARRVAGCPPAVTDIMEKLSE